MRGCRLLYSPVIMRVTNIELEPIHQITYRNAAGGGMTRPGLLPILRGKVADLPGTLEALLLTSDLQGRAEQADAYGTRRLLGEVLVDEYLALAVAGQVPSPANTGALLAGDLFAAPNADRLGATGDVRAVWRAFAKDFRWVAGVAGNHDTFGSPAETSSFCREPGVHLLDGNAVELDEVRVAGVGGICGNPARPNRRTVDDFIAAIRKAERGHPHVLVLHEGPDGGAGQRGNAMVHGMIADRKYLVVCGHVYWPSPLYEFPSGSQVVNCDSRVLLLERA